MILTDGHWYRIHTTKGGAFDRVQFDTPRLAFRLGGPYRGGEPRTISLNAVTHVAHVKQMQHVGGERFTPIELCMVEKAA